MKNTGIPWSSEGKNVLKSVSGNIDHGAYFFVPGFESQDGFCPRLKSGGSMPMDGARMPRFIQRSNQVSVRKIKNEE